MAALAYSSFPLADPLGSTLDPMNSYVSELGAPTQPAGAFFRTTDVAAGVLIVVLAVALRGSLPRDWRRDAGATALGLAGASSVFDGWHPVACAPSADPACRLREPHTVSSVAGVTAAIASMALLGHLLGSEPGSRRAFGVFGQVAASVVTGLPLAEIPLTTADPGVGLIERIHLLCISAWLVALALLLLRDVDGHEQAQRRARASG